MKALWCSCMLGLLCMPTYHGMASTVTGTQSPSAISEMRVNSSANITCSFKAINILGLSLDRRFETQSEIVFLSLNDGQINRTTIAFTFKGRVKTKVESRGGTSLSINFTLSQLQVKDTGLYFCHWKYFENKMKTFKSNGSIIIVNEHIPKRDQCSEDINIPDIVLISLSVISIPVFLCFPFFLVYTLCKNFHKKFTPRQPANLPQSRPHHTCPPSQDSYYLTSCNSTFSQV